MGMPVFRIKRKYTIRDAVTRIIGCGHKQTARREI